MTQIAAETVETTQTQVRGATLLPSQRRLNHLQAMEAESIYILREAAAEFERPVMLYSIGKDSSVMLRLAPKGVLPGENSIPSPAYRNELQIPRDDRLSRQLHQEIGNAVIVRPIPTCLTLRW